MAYWVPHKPKAMYSVCQEHPAKKLDMVLGLWSTQYGVSDVRCEMRSAQHTQLTTLQLHKVVDSSPTPMG